MSKSAEQIAEILANTILAVKMQVDVCSAAMSGIEDTINSSLLDHHQHDDLSYIANNAAGELDHIAANLGGLIEILKYDPNRDQAQNETIRTVPGGGF